MVSEYLNEKNVFSISQYLNQAQFDRIISKMMKNVLMRGRPFLNASYVFQVFSETSRLFLKYLNFDT